ncbi:MAG: hypothetical protein Q9Q40_09880 [Acidobacteriota bacterium]|nr:hypothetical protein [Acidobacteriota bacterium]
MGKAETAATYARKKVWPPKKLAKRFCDALQAKKGFLRFRDSRGVWYHGTPYEQRGDFIVFRRRFAHRKRDKRLGLFVGIKVTAVIDKLPAVTRD